MSWPRIARERAYRLEQWKKGEDPYEDMGWREKLEDLLMLTVAFPFALIVMLIYLILSCPLIILGAPFIYCNLGWDAIKSQPAVRRKTLKSGQAEFGLMTEDED